MSTIDLASSVKPLVWVSREDIKGLYEAESPIGWFYSVFDLGNGHFKYIGEPQAGLKAKPTIHPTLESAQSAAQADYAARALATIDTDKIAALVDAVDLAANRLHSLSVEFDTGTRLFIEAGEWADDARAALSAFKGETP